MMKPARQTACAFIALATTGHVSAAEKIWTGAAGTLSWHDALNWQPQGVPTASDDVLIDAAGEKFTVVLSGNTTINSLMLHAGLTVSGGINLTINSNSQVEGTLNLIGGLQGPGDLTVNGIINWIGLNNSPIGGGSRLTVNPKGFIHKTGRGSLTRTLDNHGHILTSGQTGLSVSVWIMSSGYTLNNFGTFEWNVASGASLRFTGGSPLPSPFNNYGSFIKNGLGLATFQSDGTGKIPFNNFGSVIVDAGDATLGTGVHTGHFDIVCSTCSIQFGQYGNWLKTSAMVTGAGTMRVAEAGGPPSEVFICDGSVDLDGTLWTARGDPVFNGPVSVRGTLLFGETSNNPTVTFNGAVDLEPTGNLYSQGSPACTVYFNGPLSSLAGELPWTHTNIHFAQDIVVSREFTWKGANLFGGKITVTPTGTFNEAITTANAVLHTVVENHGVMNLMVANFPIAETGGISNHGALNCFGPNQTTNTNEISGVLGASPTPSFINHGIMKKFGAGGLRLGTTSLVYGPLSFENHGQLTIEQGRLEITEPASNYGEIDGLSGTILRFHRSSFHSPESSLFIAGDLGLSYDEQDPGDVHELNGNLDIPGRLIVYQGMVTLHDEISPGVPILLHGGNLQTDVDQFWPAGIEIRAFQLGNSGGTLSGAGNVTLGGTSIFRGTMGGTGTTFVMPDALLTTAATTNGSPKLERRLENHGTFDLGLLLTMAGGELVNAGVLNLENGPSTRAIRAVSGSNSFVNLGNMNVLNAGEFFIDQIAGTLACTNDNLINVMGGTLTLKAGLQGAGHCEVFAFSLLRVHSECSIGSMIVKGTVEISPGSRLILSGDYAQVQWGTPAETGALRAIIAHSADPIVTVGGSVQIAGALDVTLSPSLLAKVTQPIVHSLANDIQGKFGTVISNPAGMIQYSEDQIDWLVFGRGDVNNDHVVNVSDLLALIDSWGVCPAKPNDCPADMNFDEEVNVADILTVVNYWGYTVN